MSKANRPSKSRVAPASSQGTTVTAPEFAANNPAAPQQVAPAAPAVPAKPAKDNTGLVVIRQKYSPRDNNPSTRGRGGDYKSRIWGMVNSAFAAAGENPVTVANLLAGGLSAKDVSYLLSRKRITVAL